MATMLDFFFYNEISPKEKLGPTSRTIEASIKKRINAVIAIMRDIEKTQTKPTVAMIESHFQTEKPKKTFDFREEICGRKERSTLSRKAKYIQRTLNF